MKVFLYILDTLADWEIAYLTAEIHSRRYFKKGGVPCDLVKVGKGREAVTTMGGIRMSPDIALAEMDPRDEDLIVLPGADTWMGPENGGILRIAKERIEKDLPVAAICGATAGLAGVGALDGKKHTSNDKSYLVYSATGYKGGDNYVEQPAVNDRNLITASGLHPVEFTHEVLKVLDVFKPETLEAWFNLTLSKEPRYYFSLIQSIG